MMKYHELLRSYIENSGLTLFEIGERLKEHNYNISKGYLSQLQNGKTDRPATDELNRALAAVTGGDLEALLIASAIEKAPHEIKEKFARLEKLKELKKEYENTITVKESSAKYTLSEDSTSKIPVLGSIAAGQPIDRIESFEGFEIMDNSLLRGRKAFALRVKGESMIGDFIADGDIVVCVEQKEVLPNDIAVVAVNSELATLKRVKCQDGVCMLIPSNPKMQPSLVSAANVVILGKVIEVRRRY